MVIIFKTMEEFDRLMLYAARENLVWTSGTPPNRTASYARARVSHYLHRDGNCAICVDKDHRIGYSPVKFYRDDPAFRDHTFKTAQEILDTGIDCTIPEKETT
jgi:hypothetical protein